MVRLNDVVGSFSEQICSRLNGTEDSQLRPLFAPQNTSLKPKTKKSPMEVGNAVLYNGAVLRFMIYSDNRFGVYLESGGNSLDHVEVSGRLNSPEKYISSSRAKEYRNMLSLRSIRPVGSNNYDFEFEVPATIKDCSDIFDAFWFRLKPLLKLINDTVEKRYLGDEAIESSRKKKSK